MHKVNSPPVTTVASQAGLSMQWQIFLGLVTIGLFAAVVAAPTVTSIMNAKTSDVKTDTTATTTTTTANPYPCGNMTTMISRDLSISQIGLQTGIPWTTCCAACLTNATCGSFSWTLAGHNCYWKIFTTSNGTNNTGVVSAKYG